MKRFAVFSGVLVVPVLLGAQDAPKPQTVGAAPAPVTTLPLKLAPKPTKAAITAEDLMTRLYVFADDSMMGREAGTLGSVKATDYLAAEAKRIGLIPAGDNGTYFQTLPLKQRKVDPMSTFMAGTAPLAFGKDWAVGGQSTFNKENLETVYGGVYGDTVNRITSEQAAGKLVVMSVPLTGPAINGAVQSPESPVPASAAAVALLLPGQVMPQVAAYMHRAGITVADGPPEPLRVFLAAGAASMIFTKALNELVIGDAGAKVAMNAIVTMTDNEFPARNVVGILPGSDPVLKNQYVAVGAHSDHEGMSRTALAHDSMLVFNRIVRPGGAEDGGKKATPEQVTQINAELVELRKKTPARSDSVFNGADDDGSGSVAVLEIAESMAAAKTKPKRSTLFVWHVGEEKGLWGSHFFTEHSTVPRDSIVAQLNMDMVGRGAPSDQTGMTKDGKELRGGPDYLQLVGSRRLSTELGDMVDRINTGKKHGFTFDYAMDANDHPMNIYCRSDHYEYAKFGIPVTFFTTGGHSAYHQLTDEPQYIDYPHMTRVAKLVADIALELGNGAKRPLVDKPLLDPKGTCKQ
ncbi:MAG: M28 family peptidase [Gemmatimonadaceae bacterium]|nr:M28 family peptidase [Gemmatimonadaceae bacterium]